MIIDHELKNAMATVLPGASLRRQRLPGCPAVELALLDAVGLERRFDPVAMQRIMDQPLYWLFCWASGQVLARHVLDRPALVRGRRVLDFGCGSGVVAIAAALAGAREVIACDTDDLALRSTACNARLNGVSLELRDDYASIGGALDVILVADVLYDRANLGWLTEFSGRAPVVLLADSRIRDFAVPPYRRVASCESCTVPDLDESREFNRVAIYRADSPANE